MRHPDITRTRMRFILSMLLLSLLLVSCARTNGTSQRSPSDTFRVGSEGIIAQFQQTFGKEIVVSGENQEGMSFLLEVKNSGSYPEKAGAEGALWLSGYDRSVIRLDQEGYTFFDTTPEGDLYLEGKSAVNPIGGSGFKEFKGLIESRNLREGKYKANILANVCYRYSTIANPSVCIEKTPFALTSEKKTCTIGDISLSGQGAPIAITKVEQIPSSDRTRFKITVKNAGKGQVIDPGLSCDREMIITLPRYSLNLIQVERISISDTELDCGNSLQEGKFRLIDGVGSFTCSIIKEDLGTDASAFSTPLDITLTYLYKDSVETPLTINKIP